MLTEAKIGRRDLLQGTGSIVGYLAASVTARNIALGLVALEGANIYLNARRTIESFNSVLKPSPPYDAVVVLGAGNMLNNGKEVPSPDGQLRVIAGVEQYMKDSAKFLRFAGGARSGTPEAKIMATYATDYAPLSIKGISGETESLDTVSNISQIIEWKKKNPGVRKIAVSTNAYHMVGVQVLGKNLGIDLYPVVAEQALLDTGKPDLIKRVRDLYEDPSFKKKIEKEQARLAMLLLDPESQISHERGEWEKRHPAIKFAFEKMYEALAIAGKQLFPLDAKSVI